MHSAHRGVGWKLIGLIGLVAGSVTPAAEDVAALPPAVQEAIGRLKPHDQKALIVRTAGGPWLVAAASGNASAKVPAVMRHDSATRAAIVEAKREMAELLSAETAVFVATGDIGPGPVMMRKVTIAVKSQILARVQLLEERYDPAAERCRVIIASAPGAGLETEFEFHDATMAARHFLDRCCQRFSSPGVICARLAGGTIESPRLVFISVAVGPRDPAGRRTVASAKAQAALTKFWGETLDGRVTLDQGQIPDPDDPAGSRFLTFEYLQALAKNANLRKVLPPFEEIGADCGDISCVAIWCTN
jgi:hypothetical protein